VNVAASRGHTKLFADVYSVAPSGIFVRGNSQIVSPADLAGVPVSVGFQSGSHYTTIQALETYLEKDQIKLSFDEGMLFSRMGAFFEGRAQAATLFGGRIISPSNLAIAR
jgi:ABC-type nitrate/sulfonate/bicarbonate transport system substrate-binding protein